MCDTFVHIPLLKTQSVIFGKNSDREPNEAQQIVCYPAKIREKNTIKTTFIEVEHQKETFEVILSKPFHMFGAEMGCNEFGVTIGNEAVFTKTPFDKSNNGLTGMDLLRLSLEISKTAKHALENIIYYLEKYGQDACGGYTDKNFYYHNSFIIADKNEGYVLETSGKHWIYEKILGYRAISNGLSIEEKYDGISEHAIDFANKRGWIKKGTDFSFKKAYSAWLMPKLADCEYRRNNSELKGKSYQDFSVQNAFQILRSHGEMEVNFQPHKSKTTSICMHASGLFTPHQTVGSMVAELRKDNPSTIWLTGTSAPCLSVYKPFYLGNDILHEKNFAKPHATYDNSYWWQWEKLHRKIIKNYNERFKLIANDIKIFENKYILADNDMMLQNQNSLEIESITESALLESAKLLKKWNEEILNTKDEHHFLYDLFWKKTNSNFITI